MEKLYHEIIEKTPVRVAENTGSDRQGSDSDRNETEPQMGAVLQELLEMVLDQPEMNEKEKLLAWWKEHGTCQKAEGTL